MHLCVPVQVEPPKQPVKPVADDKVKMTKPANKEQNVPKQPELIETVFEKLTTDSVTDSSIDTPPLHFEIKEPQSVPLSKNDLIDNNLNAHRSASNLNSGPLSQMPKLFRRRTNASNVFPVGCMGCKDESNAPNSNDVPKQEAGSFTSQTSKEVERNSLTGTETHQATRRRLIKRKDGNPLLGIGYDDFDTVGSNTVCKVPPGGRSHNIW
ncbi:uncharacterized protein LOC116162850 isoform X2 [Photinus pyralis]|uniref:uncharacterized protein LOC116162850 isoform X2 n=1 Tax=Photinus pyralis TaxID=7054 RepID=UPI0012671820|nr:uncharacterized protein LOC116162850 isoform X2 [Photinus pyralis]